MDKVELLGGLLKRVGNYSMKTFSDRVIFQKTVYFIQAFGIQLGYPFNWYIRGPYSPSLATDGYSLAEKYEKIPEVYFAEPEAEASFKRCLSFLGNRKNDVSWLELLASIHFLRSLGIRERSKIFNEVRKKQPYLSDAAFEEAWDYLKQHGLIRGD